MGAGSASGVGGGSRKEWGQEEGVERQEEGVQVEKGWGWRGRGGMVNLHGLFKPVWHDNGIPRIFPFTLEDSVSYVT